MGTYRRRNGLRIPLQIFLNEYVNDRRQRCMSLNIGTEGIYLNRLVQPVMRLKPVVGLEFELPGTGEVVWAAGEICYDSFDEYFHGTGIRFTAMAEMHRRLIRDYVREQRSGQLRSLLNTIRRHRAS